MEKSNADLQNIVMQLGLSNAGDYTQIDSLSLMSLVLEIEQSFKIDIEFQDIKSSHFTSFENLNRFIDKKITSSEVNSK